MTRRRWAAAIFAAWALCLGLLVKRVFFRTTGERLVEAARSVPPGTVFYRVDLAGQQLGFASTTVDTVGPALRVTDVLLIEVPALGRLHRTRARSRAMVSRALRLETLDVMFDGDEGRFLAHADVVGDSILAVSVSAGGETQTTRIRLTQPVVVPSMVPLRLAFGGGFTQGRNTAIRVFDPFLLSLRDVTVTIGAESTLVVPDSAGFDSTAMMWTAAHFDTARAFRIEQTSEGLTTSSWVDAQGRVVRTASPAGLTFERSAWEITYRNFRHRDTTRLARASETPAPGVVLPVTALAAGARFVPRKRAEYRAVLSGADLSRLTVTGDRQRLEGDTLIVVEEPPAALTASYRLPARDSSMAQWLASQPLIQSGDPRIRTQAHAIVGEEDDPARAAERLARWVTAQLRPAPATDMASAVRALAQHKGDCNDFTVTYVALARAIGLPARPVAGIVNVAGRFYYHAWPEVYLNSWVAIDPMLGQFPADAMHIRFVVNGLARQIQLIRFIGRLTVEGL